MNVRFLTYSLLSSLGLYFALWLIYFEKIENLLVFLTSAFFVLVYHCLVIASAKFRTAKSELFVFYVIIIFFFTGVFNAIYIDHRGDNFEFTASDSSTYQRYSLRTLEFGYFEGLRDFISESRYGYDDAGMIAYLSFLYRIIENPFFPRFVNVLISILTVFMLYRLARSCLEADTAMIISMMFGAASYNVYYMSSGLKETVFVFLILLVIYAYKIYNDSRKKRYLVFVLIALLSVFLFRIPTALFLIVSIIGAEFLRRSRSIATVLTIGLVGLTIVVGYVLVFNAFNQYLFYLNPDVQQTEAISSSLLFKVIGLAAGIFGPFPTIPTITGKEADSLWAASLILKGFVSMYFVYGVYLAFKTKNALLLVSAIFCLLNVLSLVAIGKTFKVRYIMPYFPLFFLLAGFAYDTITSTNKYPLFKKSILPINLGVVLLIIFWNILRV